ncbi:MAG TPA: methylmalonyl-CoA mutase family protein [Firmicutes bacterium]|nr:methylmalonyl-CoA mutase family protein [Bacillota bacterium]
MAEELQRAEKEWRRRVEREKERPGPFETVSGKKIKDLYTPRDTADLDYRRDLGFPGEYPFTRGVQPNMYRGRLWTMRQFSGFGDATDSNRRYRYLLEQGQTGLSVAFDMPTIMGYDSDHPRSAGEVGRCGVAIDSLEDMEILFEAIPLEKITTSMTINGPAAVLWCFYLACALKRGIGLDRVGGTIQNDILKEYTAQKSWIFPPEPSMRLITDIFAFAAREVPRWNTVSISGYHIREAGSTAVQELAFTLADGFAYVEAGIEAGLDVDDFAPRLSFFFNAHLDFFEEICKYRAARRIWARHMKERFGAKDPRSWKMRFHTQTAGCSLTAQEPENNIVRTALEALAAVLGGTQSLHTNSMDEVLALPTEKAVKIALRTQQIIAFESGAAHTIDPLAGSYFIESLTDEMEAEAESYFERIEALGGVLTAIEKGFFQQEIADAAYTYQRAVEKGERVVVGVNRFASEEALNIALLKIDAAVEQKQIARLRRLKERRDNIAVAEALRRLGEAAAGSENLIPHILKAAQLYATEGEIISALKKVFGEYREQPIF